MGQRPVLRQFPDLSGPPQLRSPGEPFRASPATARRTDNYQASASKPRGKTPKPGSLAFRDARNPGQNALGKGRDSLIDMVPESDEGWNDCTDIISGFREPVGSAWALDGIERGRDDKVEAFAEQRLSLKGEASEHSTMPVGMLFDDLVAACEQQLYGDVAWVSSESQIIPNMGTESSRRTTDRELELGKLTIKGLRTVCRSYGLVLKGTKSELVRRIVAHEQHVHQTPPHKPGISLPDLFQALPEKPPKERLTTV